MKAPHLLRGQRAERTAQRWLQGRGLRPVATNFRCPQGELDLVMLDQSCLVVIEVRLRTRSDFGDGFATITAAKQSRLARATEAFLRQYPEHGHRELRFDAVSVSRENGHLRCDWLTHAFSIDGPD